MFELFVSEYPFELVMFSQLLLVVPNTSAIVSRVWLSVALVAALSMALKIVSPQETDAPVRAASALVFPSNAPSTESSRFTDCSKFKISVVCSLTVFVRFERFDVALLSNDAFDARPTCSTEMAVALVEMSLASSIVLLSRTEMRFVLLEMSPAIAMVFA